MSIALLINLCSKNQDWETLEDIDLFRDFLDSFLMTISGKYPYSFYFASDYKYAFFFKLL